MSEFLSDLESEMEKIFKAAQRRADADEREKEREAKREVDEIQETTEAKRDAVAARKLTLDMAWAAAERINIAALRDPAKARPKFWEYTYEKPKWPFGHTAMQGIAAQGWQLLDWQNTRYTPSLRHTLILTPEDKDNSGVYLSFFSQDISGGGPTTQLLPQDVHELSREPLSESDMPWPGFIDTSTMSDFIEDAMLHTHKRRPLKAPWKGGRSLTFDGFDSDRDWADTMRQVGAHDTSSDTTEKEPPTADDYTEYLRTGTEEAIRHALAEIAVKHGAKDEE